MNFFLRIELLDKTKTEIMDKLTDFKKTYPQFQWEPADNYGILVQSFGDFLDKKSIINRLETALFDKNAFYLYVFEVALTIQVKITLFLDFRREKEIERISESIKQQFQTAKMGEKYIPRIILAHYKIPSKQQYFVIKKRLSNIDIDLSFKVNKISLFEGDKKVRSFKLP